MVVVVEPVWQGVVAVSMCAVAEAVGPFARHGLVEALDFAVCAWPVGLGGEMADALSVEQRVE